MTFALEQAGCTYTPMFLLAWSARQRASQLQAQQVVLTSVSCLRYPHTAFGVVLPNSNRTEAWARLKELEEASYIDEATRLMTVEVLVYSPSLDLWCLLVFTLEQDKSGGVIPSSRFQTVRLFSMLEKETAMAIGLEVCLVSSHVAVLVVTNALGFRQLWQRSLLPSSSVSSSKYASKAKAGSNVS